ncbi:divergent polysaccharide deacetylase family protein [Thalassotalea euphylliae]|uniref:divergent polysaccharide deacetylase family protein n=1 Tax=Thalassotalea euphylliae TaxID=1655234 RepID=UPI00362CFE4F
MIYSLVARFSFFLLLLISTFSFAQPAQVAIVIDDIGYRMTDKNVLNIPGKVTFAVLPHTPFGERIAKVANARNQEVILHIPMESTLGKKLGPGALTSDMDEKALRQSLTKSLEEVPFAVGINNHMGSHLTTLTEPMIWTMQFLKDNNMLFLDSVTSPNSLGKAIANQLGVPVMSRHVFLDNHLNHDYIAGQFKQLIRKAKKNQVAIAIAHPHPQTVESLSRLIPQLKQNNIELVPLSSLYLREHTNLAPSISAE